MSPTNTPEEAGSKIAHAITQKQRLGGLIFILLGVAGFLYQIRILNEQYLYYKVGLLCSAFVVIGIAMFFLNYASILEKDDSGKLVSKSFGEWPWPWKIVMGLSILAGIGQMIYFEMGAPGLLT